MFCLFQVTCTLFSTFLVVVRNRVQSCHRENWQEEELGGVTLLVFANKQDLPDALSSAEAFFLRSEHSAVSRVINAENVHERKVCGTTYILTIDQILPLYELIAEIAGVRGPWIDIHPEPPVGYIPDVCAEGDRNIRRIGLV